MNKSLPLVASLAAITCLQPATAADTSMSFLSPVQAVGTVQIMVD